MKRLVALAVLFLSSSALANGRYPQSGEIAVDPEDPNHIVNVSTYGVNVTRDHGGSWGWICEPAVGYPATGTENPSAGIMHGGKLIVGLFEGLSTTTDFGCNFTLYPALQKRYVVDVAVDKVDDTKAVLVTSNSVAGTTFLTQVWSTEDTGVTWAQSGADLPSDFVALTLDSAPSDPNTIYVSGRLGAPTYAGVLEKSVDRGASWQEVSVTGSDDKHLPFVGAIDPHDAGRLYVRLDADKTPDALVYSTDAGNTWTTAFTAVGNLYGFALSPDGTKVAVSGDDDGVWVAPTDTMKFEKKSDTKSFCLTWTESGLYTCAKEAFAGFEVGLSTDEGATFVPLEHLPDLCPKKCDAGSSVDMACPSLWDATRLNVGSTCEPGVGASGSDAATATSAGAGGGAATDGATETTSGGCGCHVGAPGDAAAGVAALVALALVRRRRRP